EALRSDVPLLGVKARTKVAAHGAHVLQDHLDLIVGKEHEKTTRSKQTFPQEQ
ncbi:unnamed protein product, partial [Symbiodinium natans]